MLMYHTCMRKTIAGAGGGGAGARHRRLTVAMTATAAMQQQQKQKQKQGQFFFVLHATHLGARPSDPCSLWPGDSYLHWRAACCASRLSIYYKRTYINTHLLPLSRLIIPPKRALDPRAVKTVPPGAPLPTRAEVDVPPPPLVVPQVLLDGADCRRRVALPVD